MHLHYLFAHPGELEDHARPIAGVHDGSGGDRLLLGPAGSVTYPALASAKRNRPALKPARFDGLAP